MQYADTIVKKYLQYAQRNSAQTDPFGEYEDPTYLGFYFYISTNSSTNTSTVEDYAYDFYTDGLFRPNDDPNGAYYYLKSRGELYRAEMIAEFRDKFLNLTQNYPWYLVSVSGLADLWKFEAKQNFRGKDKKIVFETNESIDLKMTYLIDLYRKASFDTRYMRYMLPENLRYFNAELIVSEIRSIHTLDSPGEKQEPVDESLNRRFTDRTLDAAVSALGGDALGISGNQLRESFSSAWNDPVKSLKELLIGKGNSKYPLNLAGFDSMATFLKFDLGGCEFDVYNDAPKYLDTLTNTAGEAVKNNFTIKVNYVKETNTYGLLGAVLKDTQYFQDRERYALKLTDEKFGSAIEEYTTLTKRGKGVNNQGKRQAEIEKANAGILGLGNLGGIAGNMINQGINTAVGNAGDIEIGGQSLNGLAQAFKAGILGNVYKDDGPSVSEILASTTSANLLGAAQQLISRATSPELAQSIIDKIVLESPLIAKDVSPEKSEGGGTYSSSGIDPSSKLEGKPSTTAGDTDGGNNAVFVVKGTEPSVNLVGSSLSSVPMLAPSSSSTINPKVELEAAPVSTDVQPKVELTGVGNIEGAPGIVTLTGVGELEGETGKTELTGDGELEGRPGVVELVGKGSIQAVIDGTPSTVDLEGIGELEGNPGKEELIGIGQLEGAPGSVELTGIGDLDGNPGKTLFQDNGAELEGNPGQEFLDGADVRLIGITGSTDLTSAPVELEGNPGKEFFVGANVSIEGNTGSVQLEGEGKLEGKPGSTDLTDNGAELEGGLSNVNLTGSDSNLNGETGKTELEAPPTPEAKLAIVELTGEGKLEGKPGSTKLVGPETEIEGYTGKVELESGTEKDIEERNIGNVELDGEGRLEGNPGKVNLKAPETQLEANIGKVRFEEPKINNDIPTKEELIAPSVARADRNAKVDFEGPTVQLDANEGNVNLSGPTTNLTTDYLGNSNPEQTLFENSDEE